MSQDLTECPFCNEDFTHYDEIERMFHCCEELVADVIKNKPRRPITKHKIYSPNTFLGDL